MRTKRKRKGLAAVVLDEYWRPWPLRRGDVVERPRAEKRAKGEACHLSQRHANDMTKV
jgi:hypothetical protein